MFCGRSCNNGFGVVEFLAIIVVLAALGVAGWVGWQEYTSSKDENSNKTPEQQIQEHVESLQQRGYESFEGRVTGVSFWYPDDWMIITPDEEIQGDTRAAMPSLLNYDPTALEKELEAEGSLSDYTESEDLAGRDLDTPPGNADKFRRVQVIITDVDKFVEYGSVQEHLNNLGERHPRSESFRGEKVSVFNGREFADYIVESEDFKYQDMQLDSPPQRHLVAYEDGWIIEFIIGPDPDFSTETVTQQNFAGLEDVVGSVQLP